MSPWDRTSTWENGGNKIKFETFWGENAGIVLLISGLKTSWGLHSFWVLLKWRSRRNKQQTLVSDAEWTSKKTSYLLRGANEEQSRRLEQVAASQTQTSCHSLSGWSDITFPGPLLCTKWPLIDAPAEKWKHYFRRGRTAVLFSAALFSAHLSDP